MAIQHKCNKCGGSGEMSITVHSYKVKDGGGLEETTQQPVHITCVYCKGHGYISDEKKKQLEWENGLWCKCGNPSKRTKYFDDGVGVIHKHHWCCEDCGKIVQIG